MTNYKPLSVRVVFAIEDLWLEWVEETGMTQELATIEEIREQGLWDGVEWEKLKEEEEDYLAFVKYTREQE